MMDRLNQCLNKLQDIEGKNNSEQIEILTDYAELILDYIDVLKEQNKEDDNKPK